MTNHRFQTLSDARAFALAGNAILTLQSLRTGVHFTYRVKQARDRNTDEPQPGVYFVSLLTSGSADEGSFHYLGMIKENEFFATKATNGRQLSPSFKAFQFFFNTSTWKDGQIHPELVIRHENHCGRCGRTLTHPESIDLGIGPECIKMMA